MKGRIAKALAVSAAGILAAAPALAQTADLGLEYAGAIGLPEMDIRTMVASVIRALMGFLGLLLVIQVLWGGFLYMTHGGDEEKRVAAIATIKNSVIGLFLIMSSTAIAKFVVDAVAGAAGTYF
jgi:hypothetical protein